jgi:hypothetical protein
MTLLILSVAKELGMFSWPGFDARAYIVGTFRGAVLSPALLALTLGRAMPSTPLIDLVRKDL